MLRPGVGRGMCSWFAKRGLEHKIVYIAFVTTLVVTFASTALAIKYDDYIDYIVWGVFIYAALLIVSAFFLIGKKNAA